MKKAIICTLCAIAALNAAACGQVNKNVQINDTSTTDANTTSDICLSASSKVYELSLS